MPPSKNDITPTPSTFCSCQDVPLTTLTLVLRRTAGSIANPTHIIQAAEFARQGGWIIEFVSAPSHVIILNR